MSTSLLVAKERQPGSPFSLGQKQAKNLWRKCATVAPYFEKIRRKCATVATYLAVSTLDCQMHGENTITYPLTRHPMRKLRNLREAPPHLTHYTSSKSIIPGNIKRR